MIKISIIYDSKTGNTQAVAKYMADGMNETKDFFFLVRSLAKIFFTRISLRVDFSMAALFISSACTVPVPTFPIPKIPILTFLRFIVSSLTCFCVLNASKNKPSPLYNHAPFSAIPIVCRKA